ncbi:hypothetical protein IPG41_03860 [Candidatus Peregrinibacteria bacterium]|nr:MAG: hypothetical protein IPG41_03860 [Candidatus Peregrinibacteria bacterium]
MKAALESETGAPELGAPQWESLNIGGFEALKVTEAGMGGGIITLYIAKDETNQPVYEIRGNFLNEDWTDEILKTFQESAVFVSN